MELEIAVHNDPGLLIEPPSKRGSNTSGISFDNLDSTFFINGDDEDFAFLLSPSIPTFPKQLVTSKHTSGGRKRRASPFSPFNSGESLLSAISATLSNEQEAPAAPRELDQNELLERLEAYPGDFGDLPNPMATDVEMADVEPPPPPQDETMAIEPRLGIYTQAEREARLEQYRQKRRQRSFGQVRYVLRQRVSEQRPRVKGRFIKHAPLEQLRASQTPPISPVSSTTASWSSPASAPLLVEVPSDDMATPEQTSLSERFKQALYSPLSTLSRRSSGNSSSPPQHHHSFAFRRSSSNEKDRAVRERSRILSWPIRRATPRAGEQPRVTFEFPGFAVVKSPAAADSEPAGKKRTSVTQALRHALGL